MSSVHLAHAHDGTVRQRLIRAADAEIALRGVGAVRMDAVARRAGVSRATAFRQMGTVYELIVQVALSHAKQHEIAVRAAMEESPTALAKLQAALIYSARELPHDPAVYGLIAQHPSSSHRPSVHLAAMRALESVLLEGRKNHEIRDDVSTDEMVDFLVEQVYLAAEAEDRSEEAVRRRFRNFIMPCLTAPSSVDGAQASTSPEFRVAIQATLDAMDELARQLRELL